MNPSAPSEALPDRIWQCIRRISSALSRRLGRRPGEYIRHRRGREAEEAAARYLRKSGYRILTRNFACTGGEIDLIAFRDGTVVFVEVRSVTEPAGVDPLKTIDRSKQHRIIRAAHRYATLWKLRQENVVFRFDAVAVRRSVEGRIQEIEHVENAFRE